MPTLRATAKWCALLIAANFWWCCAPLVDARTLDSAASLSEEITAPPQQRRLRVLLLGNRASQTHHKGALEFSILTDYARSHRRQIEWIPVFRTRDLYSKLVRGEADLAIGALPADLADNPAIASTHPLASERYQLIGRIENAAADPLQLRGMRIGIRLSSPLWSYFEKLQRIVPNLQLDALPGDLAREAALRLVADGVYDATVLPSTLGEDDLAANPRLKRLFDLTDFQPVGWFMRSDQLELLASLNQFIERYHAAYFEPVRVPRDFAAIKERGILRAITRVDPRNYFIHKGSPAGYEFELVSAFAEAHGVKLEVLVADSDQQLVQWLKDGAGDIVTARIDQKAIHGDPGIASSRKYHHTAYVVVSKNDVPLRTEGTLRDKVLIAYENSAEQRALASTPTLGLKSVESPAHVPNHQLYQQAAAGEFDGVVVNGDEIRQLLDDHPELTAGVSIPHAYDYRWLVRGTDSSLLEAINRFLKKSHREGLDRQLVARYFENKPGPQLAMRVPKRISPFDHLMRTYAERYSFDWRLIAAQMYQESQFDPRAVSTAGAQGLMQMLPGTAEWLGFKNLNDPNTAIHAGVKYLDKLRQEFDEDIPASERTWFALAAYNIGLGHVKHARQVAQKMDLDPNRWFGNVETAMLRYARPRNGRKPDRRYGQAIVYVRQIQSLYGTYRRFSSVAMPGFDPRGRPLPLSSTDWPLAGHLFAAAP